MGTTTRTVPFIDDRTAIRVTEGSAEYMTNMISGRSLSLRKFARGDDVIVEEVIETGELIFRTVGGTRFACGVTGA